MVDSKELKSRIRKTGMTQAEFAESVGMSKVTMWRKLNGVTAFTINEADAIAAALKLNKREKGAIFFNHTVAELQQEAQ